MSGPSPKVRLIDIARRAGVSRAAVGHVLNHSGQDSVRVSEATRRRVLKIAKDMNYRPNRAAQQLRGKPTRMLGVILDTVNTAVFSARLACIEAEAHRRGYRMVMGQVHHEPSEIQGYLDDFADRGIEGVLCLFDVMQDIRPMLEGVFEGRRGIVIHAAPILNSQPCVRVNTTAAIEQIVDHLLDRGRRRIGLQLWSMTDRLMTLRRQAWESVLARRGLPADEELIWINPLGSQRPSREIIEGALDRLISEQSVDAIIASNDEWAVSFIQGLRRRGLNVPRDVAITGYDNLPISEVIEPALTTIDQCHNDYAVAALDLLEASLQGGPAEAAPERIIQPRLIIREST